jgi:Fur family ferric uptake transcriptional regulator
MTNKETGGVSPDQPITANDMKARIRAAGLRCTRARVAVLGRLLHASGPVSHAEMAGYLADEGFDQATIYRNLTELTEAGLATRVDLGDHVWRFEPRRHHASDGRGEDHPHFVCTSCGEVSCLDEVSVALTPKPGADRSGRLAAGVRAVNEVVLKGQCENCGDE